MGPADRQLVDTILTTTTPQGGALATVFGLVTLLMGATAVFGELQSTLRRCQLVESFRSVACSPHEYPHLIQQIQESSFSC